MAIGLMLVVWQRWVDGTSPQAVLIDEWKAGLEKFPKSNLIVAITTDKGLCGGKKRRRRGSHDSEVSGLCRWTIHDVGWW